MLLSFQVFCKSPFSIFHYSREHFSLYQLLSTNKCVLKGKPNLYFLSELLAISTG